MEFGVAPGPCAWHSLLRAAVVRPRFPPGGNMTLASRSDETASLTSAPRDLHRSWTREEALALHDAPFNDLLFQAQTIHRKHFDPNKVQLSRLLSIKTGGCPEDCGYCSQSSHHDSGLKASKLMEVERVFAEARKARAAGATPHCLGRA